MGLLLREALRMLCRVNNQWTYAVFWKIGCQNTNLLIWEECYYEPVLGSVPSRITGIESSELPFGEWEGCWGSKTRSSQPEIQKRDKVHLLINKMMMNNRITLVGEGIVGRAAFTGNHQWILANNYNKNAHPPEVLNEIHLQFSVGMQTVAVIPVVPQGVVQLGSSLSIMENLGFVNDVKSLILQLGCVPGALLSGSYGAKESEENLGAPVSLGMHITMDPSGMCNTMNSTPLVAGNCSQQIKSSQPSRLVDQQHFLVRQIQDKLKATTSTFQTPSLTQTLVKANDEQCEPKMSQVMKSTLPFREQPEDCTVGAEVIPSNLEAWLNQQASSSNSRSGLSCQTVMGQAGDGQNSLKLMEQQILSDAGFQKHGINNVNARNLLISPQFRGNEGLVLDSHGDSITTPLLERSELHNIVNEQVGPISVLRSLSNSQKAANINSSCTNGAGTGLPNVESPIQSTINQRILGGLGERDDSADAKQFQIDLLPKKEKMDQDLFQALNISSTRQNALLSSREPVPGYIRGCMKQDGGIVSPRSGNSNCENLYGRRQSGDDLFDIVGVDFKNKLFNENWNDLLVDGPDSRTENLTMETSTVMNMQDVSSDFYSVNGGLSDSGMFSDMGADHLLDAVVSGAHSAAKQISEDTLSCRTTLTKISSSSVPSGSTSGRVNISDQLQGKLPGLPKPLGKAGTMRSSSFGSEFTRDDAGTCSQTASMYGSQISSWVEQSQSVKRDSSVSTAYSKRNDEIAKPNRKRLKPGENPRPRPKDRQMIQDRVKELREIVPNGAKCSIDALLERTIKHMLFLQSVTKHADKLKQTGESKFINKEGGLHRKENFEGGATWAFEVGSQAMVCPIIVEDLNPPRQMLVEMLCEERGFFLEIADLIRGLGLTILKGVMEARNDKIWARFAVEANRDVTRMEIFMSLVHLLEQTVKGSALAASALDGNNAMLQHTLSQAASIAATGRASSLQ